MKDKLYRSRRTRIIGGVAGGLAQYFNIDPIIVRILFVVFTIMHGFGLLLYIVLWIVIPEEPFELAYGVKPEDQKNSEEQTTESSANTNNFDTTIPEIKKNSSGRIIAGTILIAIGLIFFADRFIPSFCFGDIFPILFVIIGAALIWNSTKK